MLFKIAAGQASTVTAEIFFHVVGQSPLAVGSGWFARFVQDDDSKESAGRKYSKRTRAMYGAEQCKSMCVRVMPV